MVLFRNKHKWVCFWLSAWMVSLVLLGACKKEDPGRDTSTRQPSVVSIYSINTVTLAETLLQQIGYAYDAASNRFDSITINGEKYRFDYSRFDATRSILLNYTSDAAPYGEIGIDGSLFVVKEQLQRSSSSTITSTLSAQYDSISRMRRIQFQNVLDADQNYTIRFTSAPDTAFIRSDYVSGCLQTDTLINGPYGLNPALSYWLLLQPALSCLPDQLALMQVLPLSAHTYPLPLRLLNGDKEIQFTYEGDSKGRLTRITYLFRQRSTNTVLAILQQRLTY